MDAFQDRNTPRKSLKARVTLVSAGDSVPNIDLAKEITVVGRAQDCDVRLDYSGISKIHCVLTWRGKSVLVRDMQSTNGTWVNGKRISRAVLQPGDAIKLAGISFTFKIGFIKDAGDSGREEELPDEYPAPRDGDQTPMPKVDANEMIQIDFEDIQERIGWMFQKSDKGALTTIHVEENISFEDEEK